MPPNICKEQSCNEQIRIGYYLCSAHWDESREGTIDKCPQCGVYKDTRYPLCIECNKKANSVRKEEAKPTQDNHKSRRYDQVKADTFDERAALLEDDPKAEDKRQLFDQQQSKCVYCGNKYLYNELQIEHMIPKVQGGPDNIRNSQLACRSCNQAKGTLTDIEFRREHVSHLPQQERTPAEPPIAPELLRAQASSQTQNRRFGRSRRK